METRTITRMVWGFEQPLVIPAMKPIRKWFFFHYRYFLKQIQVELFQQEGKIWLTVRNKADFYPREAVVQAVTEALRPWVALGAVNVEWDSPVSRVRIDFRPRNGILFTKLAMTWVIALCRKLGVNQYYTPNVGRVNQYLDEHNGGFWKDHFSKLYQKCLLEEQIA